MGPALRRACEAVGLTQERIAAELDVHQTTVSKWLVGKTWPPLEALPVIDELCGQPRGYLLRLAGFVSDEADILAAIKTDPRLSDDGRQVVAQVYDFCVRRAAERVQQKYRLGQEARERKREQQASDPR